MALATSFVDLAAFWTNRIPAHVAGMANKTANNPLAVEFYVNPTRGAGHDLDPDGESESLYTRRGLHNPLSAKRLT
jgi:hypothetical protein